MHSHARSAHNFCQRRLTNLFMLIEDQAKVASTKKYTYICIYDKKEKKQIKREGERVELDSLSPYIIWDKLKLAGQLSESEWEACLKSRRAAAH